MQKSTKLVKIKLERTLVINRGLNWGRVIIIFALNKCRSHVVLSSGRIMWGLSLCFTQAHGGVVGKIFSLFMHALIIHNLCFNYFFY